MSMHNMDDKEMDALFQEGAEHQEFSYKASSWDLMEEKLDKRDRKIFFFRILGILGLLLLVGAGIYLNQSNKSITKSTHSESIIANDNNASTLNTPVIKEDILKSDEAIEETIIAQSSKAVTSNVDSKDKTTVKEVKQNIKKSRTQEASTIINRKSERKDKILASDKATEVENEPSRITTRIEVVESANTQQTSNESETTKKTNHTTLNSIIEPASLDRSIQLARLTSLVSGVQSEEVFGLESNLALSNIPTVEAVKTTLGHSLTVYANPEWSSVGLFTQSKLGWKVGAKFGLDITDKLQGGIGIAVSQKRYGAIGEAYVPADGWIDDIVPMWMDAKCTVIEIPLEASYYFNGHHNNGFFINAGVSSYVLNSEWYGFKYDEDNMTELQLSKLVKEINPEEVETKHHVVGVGKLSFGYHHKLSSGTAFEVSPYLQIPMTGIGEGNVDLYSSGVQLAIRFNN